VPHPFYKPLHINNSIDKHDFKMPVKNWHDVKREEEARKKAAADETKRQADLKFEGHKVGTIKQKLMQRKWY